MRKTFLFALGALLSINAWAYNNTAATFKWTVCNESEATSIVSDAQASVKQTKLTVGTGLTVNTRNNLAANNGVTMTTFNPVSNKLGVKAESMVEYSITMKKGVTFTLTGISYDALKQGTDGASYHWSYAVDGVEATPVEVTQDELRRDNNTTGETPTLNHSETITAAAGQTVSVRFYVSGFNAGKLFCLSNLIISGVVNGEEEVRSFTDFKIEFRTNPYQVILPTSGELPTGVAVSGTSFNGNQHGVQGGTITVPVDGPVKFTLGACQYSKTTIAVKKDGTLYATVDNAGACGETTGNFEQNITWTYNVEEAATLTFELGNQTYLPYFFAEACDFVPQVEVRYFDTDGTTLIGSEIVDGGSVLAYKYGASDVTVAEGKAFRGWFNGSGLTATKVPAGTSLVEDLSLYAKATDIEVAALGKIFDYDFRPAYFYPEDHDILTFTGGSYNGAQHGWMFGNGQSISVEVAGNALLIVGVCTYSNTSTTPLKDAGGNTVGQLDVTKNETADGALQTIQYEGPATTLTFHFTSTNYIHTLKVYNIAQLPQKDAAGYYEIAPGDAAGLILALESMSAGDKIFLPNGIYDLGETVLTQVSKNDVSIIGQSMEGVIIRNAPDIYKEGIGTTATLYITANNTYLQDLTLQNDLDYFQALAKVNNGRGVALWDKGTKTVCKNVRLLSNQDTYYSNKQGAVKYFEDCEIHGTVDFICGDGSVYFKNNELVCEQRNSGGGGADAITASNADANDKGYVFESCSIRYAANIQGTKPVVSFGRAWNNAPKCIYLNTVLDDVNGELNMTKTASQQKDKIERWTLGAMNALPEKFGEFNTTGKPAMPSSNNVTFVLGSNEKTMETILSASEAATYTMAYTLGDWATTAAAEAKQEKLRATPSGWEPTEATIFLVETNGVPAIVTELPAWDGEANIVVRAANARGGFGYPAEYGPQAAIDNVRSDNQPQKVIRNGQVLILRDGKTYNALGQEY